jgi:hypothetical protein
MDTGFPVGKITKTEFSINWHFVKKNPYFVHSQTIPHKIHQIYKKESIDLLFMLKV